MTLLNTTGKPTYKVVVYGNIKEAASMHIPMWMIASASLKSQMGTGWYGGAKAGCTQANAQAVNVWHPRVDSVFGNTVAFSTGWLLPKTTRTKLSTEELEWRTIHPQAWGIYVVGVSCETYMGECFCVTNWWVCSSVCFSSTNTPLSCHIK